MKKKQSKSMEDIAASFEYSEKKMRISAGVRNRAGRKNRQKQCELKRAGYGK
jgi:hypothetical protein